MTKRKIYDITDPIYNHNVGFAYGGTFSEADRLFCDTSGDKQDDIKTGGNNRCDGAHFHNDKKGIYLLWLPRDYDLDTLAHELIHVLFSMFKSKGLKPTFKNQETFAYHMSWWMDKILTLTKRKK